VTVPVDIWLRGQDFATTRTIAGLTRAPRECTDDDMRMVLEGMLSEMHRLRHPDEAAQAVALRGLSWIVNPFETGGVVIAIEIGLGAAVAGPIEIDQRALEAMITRVLAHPTAPVSSTVH
jgi:hypothetical protein